jgi:hypothetical protein
VQLEHTVLTDALPHTAMVPDTSTAGATASTGATSPPLAPPTTFKTVDTRIKPSNELRY